MNARSITSLAAVSLLALPLAFSAGCGSGMSLAAAISGSSPREHFAERITNVRNSHVELKGRFTAALEASTALMNHTDREETPKELYDALKLEIRRAQTASTRTRNRVASADATAQRYFQSWRDELAEYNRNELRSFSQSQLDQTMQLYANVKASFDHADAAIDQVVGALKDQVRFLDKNLSDRAIATLSKNMIDIDREIADLNRRLDGAIAQAEPFTIYLGEDPHANAPDDSGVPAPTK